MIPFPLQYVRGFYEYDSWEPNFDPPETRFFCNTGNRYLDGAIHFHINGTSSCSDKYILFQTNQHKINRLMLFQNKVFSPLFYFRYSDPMPERPVLPSFYACGLQSW